MRPVTLVARQESRKLVFRIEWISGLIALPVIAATSFVFPQGGLSSVVVCALVGIVLLKLVSRPRSDACLYGTSPKCWQLLAVLGLAALTMIAPPVWVWQEIGVSFPGEDIALRGKLFSTIVGPAVFFGGIPVLIGNPARKPILRWYSVLVLTLLTYATVMGDAVIAYKVVGIFYLPFFLYVLSASYWLRRSSG